MKRKDPYIKLAKDTIFEYVLNKKKLEIPEDLPKEMLENKAGTFVTLKKNDNLRGCIGTLGPVRDSIAEEIIENAISAATKDPRFPEVKPDELDNLEISVDVLKESEKIDSIDKLDTKRYGVIVTSGYRRGVLLPNIEGIDSKEEQVFIALRKARISPSEPYELRRFEVIRHE